ncbi:hypothetical protein VDGE_30398 [Verticillium dahliae]|uniref:Uncharacterized protein n=1 Tax=Verticillium dahliae TaxID=27337 RepID=A0A444RQI4_VERDA|nr:hypothetical protein VDGE_30398 [Verticillium dahliae]
MAIGSDALQLSRSLLSPCCDSIELHIRAPVGEVGEGHDDGHDDGHPQPSSLWLRRRYPTTASRPSFRWTWRCVVEARRSSRSSCDPSRGRLHAAMLVWGSAQTHWPLLADVFSVSRT